MHRYALILILSLGACSTVPPSGDQGPIACTTSEGMAAILGAKTKEQVETQLSSGDTCFRLPANWKIVSLQETTFGKPAILTVDTPEGKKLFWGVPVDEP